MELAEHGVELPADSDTALVRSGWAALTSLVGVRAVEGPVVAGAVAAVEAVLAGPEARTA
jgi:hypothetical protein